VDSRSLPTAVRAWLEFPHRFVFTRDHLGVPGARVLDVGCGNHSPTITKRYFPGCIYVGLDREPWNLDESDYRTMDGYIQGDLDSPENLTAVPNGAFDVVLCSHVLEHIDHPAETATHLAAKLKPSGLMYIETPAKVSLHLPHAATGWMWIRGCLNFRDDETHKTWVDLRLLARFLRSDGFRVSAVRRRFLWRRVLLLPAYVVAGILIRGYVPASVLWDVTGFAEYILVGGRAERSPDAGPPAA
jgi:2-polyprenyl-3-methyl-5-hydroxy-6-metoxy-1,4-benzoquinol methylase